MFYFWTLQRISIKLVFSSAFILKMIFSKLDVQIVSNINIQAHFIFIKIQNYNAKQGCFLQNLMKLTIGFGYSR